MSIGRASHATLGCDEQPVGDDVPGELFDIVGRGVRAALGCGVGPNDSLQSQHTAGDMPSDSAGWRRVASARSRR